ncbi:M48 family metallopeptidase [Flavobacterium sp. J27]|uniref:tetratricopeptide repeat protein n=1 Tax=Flavobacterium sp. J27 TaxID=2060419 RepID=UPI00103006BF|nr:tetratricopeptide repeat protein [Flavobacterium sp. J27]
MYRIVLFFLPFLTFSQSNFEKGESLFHQKKYDEANVYFEAHLKAKPSDYKTIEYLGDIAGYHKKWDEAMVKYKVLKEKFPNNANYHYKYGGAMGMKAKESSKFKALGMIDEIETSFKTAAKLDAKHTDTRWALLILYLELPGILGGSEKKAQKYADELMTISKIDGVMAKGHIEEYFKRYTKAESYYLQGVNLTHSKTAYLRLINLYKKMELPKKVKAIEEESYKYNKDS